MDIVSAFSFLTEFGCGYVLLGCISRLLNLLGFFLIFGFCFKLLRFGWHTKSLIRFLCDSGGIPRIRLCPDKDQHHHPPLPPQVPNPNNNKQLEKAIKSPASLKSPHVGKANSEDGSNSEAGKEDNENEDDVFDVMSLRRLIKIGRRKANVAWSDLEKERTAAASSAEEAMAMILRLQNEKSSAEIEANQFRRMAEERLGYNQEVIEELNWVITDHETQKSLLEEEVEAYREELKLYMKEEEIKELEIVDFESGYGYGDGDSNGNGDGNGDEEDNGNGNGEADGVGEANGNDNGDGEGNYEGNGKGEGDGYGDGADDCGGDSVVGDDDDDPKDFHHSVHRHSSSETELQTL